MLARFLPFALKKWAVIVGGFMIEFVLGSHYTFGNMKPYIVSFVVARGSNPKFTGDDASYIFAGNQFTHGAGMIIAGFIEWKFGPVLAAFCGIIIFAGGVAATSKTVFMNQWLIVISYGVMYGFGKGMAYVIPIACGMRWFPTRKGLVSGTIMSAYGLGSFAFGALQTFYINPHNVPQNKETKLFDDPALLDRVPNIFLIMASIYIVVQGFGALLMSNPPRKEEAAAVEQMEPTNPAMDEPIRNSRLSDLSDPDQVRRESAEMRKRLQNKQPTDAEGVEAPRLSTPREAAEEKVGEEEKPEPEEQGDVSMSPRQVIRAYEFWMLFFTFFLNQQAIGFISTNYKNYAMEFIYDDFFISIMGYIASLLNAFCRPFWGALNDRLGYRKSIMIVCGLLTVQYATFFVPKMVGGKVLIAIWVWSIFFTFAGTHALLAACSAQSFGPTFSGSNFGMVFCGTMIGEPMRSFLQKQFRPKLGTAGLAGATAGFTTLCLIMNFFYWEKPSPQVIRKRMGLPAAS